MVNRQIVVSVLILMSAGAYRVLVAKRDPAKPASGVTITRVLTGGYILAIIASIVDLVSGVGSQIAGLLLGLAVTSSLIAVLPDLISRLTTGKGVQ